jgi:uncharacterized membrane protein YphA (DoxX/SURF4 family)
MLNPFPALLLPFLAPALLRLAAAAVFGYLVVTQWSMRDTIAQTRFPVVGSGMWIVYVTTVLECAVALSFIFGYYTQWGAILGALFALKYAVWGKRYAGVFPISRTASLLLLAVCLSLLLSGAGAFGQDLPL